MKTKCYKMHEVFFPVLPAYPMHEPMGPASCVKHVVLQLPTSPASQERRYIFLTGSKDLEERPPNPVDDVILVVKASSLAPDQGLGRSALVKVSTLQAGLGWN